MRVTTTTMRCDDDDGMGTFADGICGGDVARGDVACARGAFGARVRVVVVEGFMVHTCASRDGACAARTRAWMGADGVRDPGLARGMAIARDGDRARAGARRRGDGARAWGGVARAGKVA